MSGLPAGCSWEGATLWLISGPWFGPERAHQWAHFPSSSHSHARPLPSYESANGEWESARESERQEVILPASGPSPVSSPANFEWCDYRRNWLKHNNLAWYPSSSPTHIQYTWTVTPHTHTHIQAGQTGCLSRILGVIVRDTNGILMEHRCLLRVEAEQQLCWIHMKWLSALFPGLII